MDLKHICLPQSVSNVIASLALLTPTKESSSKNYLLQEQWSPKQIVGYCKIKQIPMVSHERSYQYIRDDKAAGGQYYKHLRHQLKHRKRPVGKTVTSRSLKTHFQWSLYSTLMASG